MLFSSTRSIGTSSPVAISNNELILAFSGTVTRPSRTHGKGLNTTIRWPGRFTALAQSLQSLWPIRAP